MFIKSPLHNIMFFILIGVMTNVHSESCDFLPPAVQPDWTFESPAIEGYYVGVGLAESYGIGADEQIEQARQSALNDLSSSIEVSVRSSLSVDIKEKKSGGRSLVDSDVRQITETITDTSLKDVEVDETWLDRKRCIVWVRVKISRKVVEEMEYREVQNNLLARLDGQYDEAKNRQRSPEERDVALTQAYVLLDEIDFKVLKGKQSKAYYKKLLDSLSSRVSKRVGRKQDAQKLREDAEKLLLQAGSTRDADQRKKLTVDAVSKLRAIIAANPIGMISGTYVGEDAAFKIAEVEKARNNACEAQLQYEIVRDRSKSNDWVSKSSQMLDTVKCNRRNKKTRSWRKEFDGVRTSFVCAYDLKGDIDEWDKPCENVASFVQSIGALSGVDTGLASSDIVKLAYKLDKNSSAADKLKDKGRVVLFVAKGKIKSRNNPKNPMGEDHQFSGKVYSYLLDNGKLEFRDKYTGTGGWNPVSEEMAMEVLGLNVAKRWKSKYLEHIKNN